MAYKKIVATKAGSGQAGPKSKDRTWKWAIERLGQCRLCPQLRVEAAIGHMYATRDSVQNPYFQTHQGQI